MNSVLQELEMQRMEEDREGWEWVAAITAVTVVWLASLLLEHGPLLY